MVFGPTYVSLPQSQIMLGFFRQVRLTCHFVIFPIRFTTENKVTSAVTVMMFEAATKRISILLKRSYSTLPEAATAARTASAPHAVRLRRA